MIDGTVEFAKNFLKKAESSHDWWHTFRVWKMAERIAKEEQADWFIISMASLLHDVADYKLNDGSDEKGLKFVKNYLMDLKISQEELVHIIKIIEGISFRKTFNENKVLTLEGQVVQDADRLDALGAIGIARTFACGGANGQKIYDSEEKIGNYKNSEEYQKNKNSSLVYFYEKILLLKNLMNTKEGKKIAKHRHQFIEDYLKEFILEWRGKN